ncbi:MAG: universal stress protein [Anaerolineae bacterium]|nr:universal stress protein [Anaerolineales bacterium]MCQ3979772.1 universal stress protein [Anaerolineae bacterium]
MSVEYKKIMVPLDGSTLAAQALPHALALVELHQAEMILFRVVQEAHFVEEFVTEGKIQVDQRQEYWLNEATTALGELAAELKLRQLKVTPVVEVGLPAEAIIDYARQHEVSLIVMSTHGRTGLARWVYGSVADKVLRGAPCPVLLVRAVV